MSPEPHAWLLHRYSLAQLGFRCSCNRADVDQGNSRLGDIPGGTSGTSGSANNMNSISPSKNTSDSYMSHMESLEVQFPGMTHKLHHRATRVSPFLTPRYVKNLSIYVR